MSSNRIKTGNIKKQYRIDIPVHYFIKHPLQNSWTLWYYENNRQKHLWQDNLREVASFGTIEDFWGLYSHIKRASELRSGCDYSLFKKGIKPMWEDIANQRGGRWLIHFDKKQGSNDVDIMWLDVLLGLIGEAFENSDEVCGATVNVRNKGHKIGLWTSDATNSTALLEIGRKLKERLRIHHKLGYQLHQDSMDKTASVTKTTYTV